MIVFDASAILCLVRSEPGEQIARSKLNGGIISSVNWSEVMQKAAWLGYGTSNFRNEMVSAGLSIREFTDDDADDTANLYPHTKHKGLSLGDRACLATAMRLDATALTTEQAWAELEFPHCPKIELLR